MFPFSQRLSPRKAQEQRHRDNILRREQMLADAKQKAGLIKELLADPRYAGYTQWLQNALDAFIQQSLLFSCQVTSQGMPVGDFANGLQLGKLLGRIDILKGLLTMPENVLALAAQGQEAQNNGPLVNPHTSEQVAS